MHTIFLRTARSLAMAALVAVFGLAPIVAAAQNVPSYARPNDEQTIHGRIRSVDGTFTITVDDEKGYIDAVHLHQGTIINPTGLTLARGMSVTILGYNAGDFFQANEIDTPYHFDGPRPAPMYYGPGWWYPGFAYGWGPSFALVLNIGGGTTVVERRFEGHAVRAAVPAPRPYVGRQYEGRRDAARHGDEGRRGER